MSIKKISTVTSVVLALTLLIPSQTSTGNNASFVVPIVNVSSSVEEMTREELFSVLTLTTTRWQDGHKITVVLYSPDNAIQKVFVRDFFGINTYRFQEMIEAKINTGRADKPIVVKTESEMVREVSKKPGRIGFAKKSVLIGDVNGIKQVKIN